MEVKEPVKNTAWTVKALNDLGCQIAEKDLKGHRPSIEILQQIYVLFLQLCLQCTPKSYEVESSDTHLMLRFSSETAEYQLQSFRLIRFYKYLLYLFDICDTQQRFYEIHYPTMNVFKKNINRLIRFAQFQGYELRPFWFIQEENKKDSIELAKLENSLNEINTELRRIQAERRVNESVVQERKKKIEELKERNSKLEMSISNQENIEEEDEKLINEQLFKLKEYKSKKQEVDKKLNLFEKLIIKSPTRLKQETKKADAEINDIKRINEEKKLELINLQKSYGQKDKFNNGFSQIEELCLKFINSSIPKSNELFERNENVIREISRLKIDFKSNEMIVNSSDSELDSIKTEQEKELKTLSDEEQSLIHKQNEIEKATKEISLENLKLETNKQEAEEKYTNSEQIFEKTMKIKIDEYEKLQKDHESLCQKIDGIDEYFKQQYGMFASYVSKLNNKVKRAEEKIYKYSKVDN